MNAIRVVAGLGLGLLAACADTSPAPDAAPPVVTFEPYDFEAADGTVVAAERGSIAVPENRSDPESRQIEIAFVRFRSADPASGPPIVYLAGGPGGSGVLTARGPRFPLFMAMREFGDVIALDQRGVNWSNSIPRCEAGTAPPLDAPLNLDRLVPELRAAADECGAFWADQGVDLAGYNTAESARDIDALRRALGQEKVSLWGISYGSHLALAALEAMPGSIERVVLAAIEGLDQTVKLPARTDAYFDRLQQAIDADPAAAAAYPDLPGLMRRVHARLEASPVEVSFEAGPGDTVTFVLGATDLRLLVAGSISDPSRARRIPAAYARADAGDFSELAAPIYQRYRGGAYPLAGMPLAMDIMSGISAERLALVRQQAETSILGDVLNFPMPHLAGAMGLPDLGEKFRRPVSSDVPTLFLSGTLDGRTYPEAAVETGAEFTSLQQVIVENGGHNVFMQAPVVSEIVLRFMRGEPVPERVTLEAPRFPVTPAAVENGG